MPLLISSVVSFCLGTILTIVVRKLARQFGVVAQPRKDRWHQKPTALLGGIAICAAFLVSAGIFSNQISARAYPIIASAFMLAIVGLIDDLREIKPYIKLICQLLAASLVVYFDLVLPWTDNKIANDLITIFSLVGITNAINLLDNMDGLAGGISFIAAIMLILTFVANGQMPEATLTGVFAGAILAFLIFNYYPASIFMGDCGSMFLGFMLGGVSLLSEYGRTRNITAVLMTPVLILLIPIFDTCLVTFTRKFSGSPISHGGRDHTSHRLVALGMSESRAVLTLYCIAAISGIFTFFLRWTGSEVVLFVVPAFALFVVSLGIYLGMVKVGALPENAKIPTLRLFIDFSYKRRVFEVLLDVLLIALAYYGAYLLRWDAQIPSDQIAILVDTLPIVVAAELLMFLVVGLYRGLWRYTGIDDLLLIARASLFAAGTTTLVVLAIYDFNGPSRGTMVINGLLLFLLVAGSRLSFRMIRTSLLNLRDVAPTNKPVLIYGAGDGGELLVRELINSDNNKFRPIGFLDDDVRKVGKALHGFKIYNSDELPRLIANLGVNEVVVSSAKVPEMRLEKIRKTGVKLRKMSIRIE